MMKFSHANFSADHFEQKATKQTKEDTLIQSRLPLRCLRFLLFNFLAWPPICFLPGCGETPAYQPPLEGVVRWQDGSEPRELEGGTIEFQSDGKVVAQTGLVGDGTFLLGKALPA